jgi:hypothetical protein
LAGILRRLEELPRWADVLGLLLVAVSAAWARLVFLQLLPCYLWSKDSISYAAPAFRWIDSGEWFIDGRRGPVYSMFIGYLTRWWGSLNGVSFAQHALEWVAIVFTVICVRLHTGRRHAWLVWLAGYALAVYGLPLAFGSLVRNEALLFFFASIAFGAWSLAVFRGSAFAEGAGGLMASLLNLTKQVLLPYPVVAVITCVGLARRTPGRLAVRLCALLAGLALPYALLSWHNHTAREVDEPQPQSGILFYGRTAQWTVLDGGIEPQIKAAIRAEVEAYRRLPKRDNNIIVHKTVVPHLEEILKSQKKSYVDLDRLCRKFALEAVRAHPGEFALQVLHDLKVMLFQFGDGTYVPDSKQLKNTATSLEQRANLPEYLHVAGTAQMLRARAHENHFRSSIWIQRTAWLFQFYPVLLTTIVVVLLVYQRRGNERWFWLGLAAQWFFTLVLLSTVGRPLSRYLMPVVPVMFWVLTTGLVAGVQWFSVRFAEPAQSLPRG